MAKEAKPTEAATEAAEVEKTDEQIWNELTGTEAKASDDAGTEAKDADTDTKDDGANGGDEADQETSEAAGDTEAAGAGADSSDAKALQAQIDRLKHSLDSEKGRIAATRRENEALKAQLAAAEEASAKAKKPDDAKTKARKDALTKAREDFGDVIGPIADQVAELEARLADLSDKEKRNLADLRKQFDTATAAEEEVFLKEHPGGFDYLKERGKAFADWVDDQPRKIRDIYTANKDAIVDGAGAAYVLSLFKQAALPEDARSDPAETRKQDKTAPVAACNLPVPRQPEPPVARRPEARPRRTPTTRKAIGATGRPGTARRPHRAGDHHHRI